MSFRRIRGQDQAVLFLKKAHERGRIAHAYLFLGPQGVGRFATALEFAKLLNCAGPIDAEPCDACVSCRRIDQNLHPDVFVLKPEEEGAVIKIEKVRDLIKDINLKPFEGKTKVYIVDGAEAMKHEAANALLKTLEEPPQEAVIILIAKELKAIAPTITSRSQIVRFFPLGIDEMKRILAEKGIMDRDKAHALYHLSSGSIGEALSQGSPDLLKKRELVIDSLIKGDFPNFEKAPREELKMHLAVMLSWYRDIFISKAGLDASFLINQDRRDDVATKAKVMTLERLDEIMRRIVRTSSFLDEKTNQNLAMSALWLQLRVE